MLLAAIALSLAGSPVLIEKSPDDIVCKSKIDRRTKMRTGKICKTRAEWEGKYEEEDAELAAAPAPVVTEQVASNPRPQ